MPKFILKESQVNRLLETGSNSAAMDLDIYTQPVDHDTSNGNESIEDSLKETITYLNQLNYMLKTGKKIGEDKKMELYSILDKIKSLYVDSTKI